MAKQVLKISDFTGGLNSYYDGKDIKDNEFQALDNAEVDEDGIIRVSGGISRDLVLDNIALDNFRLSSNVNPGTGLFSYFSDYSASLTTWTSDIYNYILDTENFSSDWDTTTGGGGGSAQPWKVSDNISPLSQITKVPRSFITGDTSISDVNGTSGTPTSLGSIKTPAVLLQTNSEYTIKFKAMCAGTDKWYYSGLSIPPHLKLHDISDSGNSYILYSNDSTGYATNNVTASNYLTNDQANMFSSSVGGWTAIGTTAPTSADGDVAGAEIKEYIGNSADIRALLVESDGDYTEPAYLQTGTSGNIGAKSPDITSTDTTDGFIANASYYLDVMCLSGSPAGAPIVEIRWKDGSDYKVLFSKEFTARGNWTPLSIHSYDGLGIMTTPHPSTSFESILFKLPSGFDTASDKLQIRVGCSGDGKIVYFTGFNLRRAMIELGNDIKVRGINSNILSYPVSYNMTYATTLWTQGAEIEFLASNPREYEYKFKTNNFIHEVYDGVEYTKMKFEFVAGKWGQRQAYTNLEFYISDISILGTGGENHALVFSEYYKEPNITDVSLSYYLNGYNQIDKSILPLQYSGNAMLNFLYTNGRLMISDGNFQNNNIAYQYYYNKYVNKFILSSVASKPPRIFNISVDSYAPFSDDETFDVLQEYLGASIKNDLSINWYAADECENNSWGVIDSSYADGQDKSNNRIDTNTSSKLTFTTEASADDGSGGGLSKHIIIGSSKLSGKSDDISNVHLRLKVYALVGTARAVVDDVPQSYPWYENEKITINWGIMRPTASIDANTDPQQTAQASTLVVGGMDSLSTPMMGERRDSPSLYGWYTELDVNTNYSNGMGGLAGPIGVEAQDGYPREYISCLCMADIPFVDGALDQNGNLQFDIIIGPQNSDITHSSLGDITYGSGNIAGETGPPPVGYTPQFTLASGLSAVHVVLEECTIDFHSGATVNGVEISTNDIGLAFTFETPSAEHTAEGWAGTWDAAVTVVNIHGEESYLRKVDFGNIICTDSTQSPKISLIHSPNLDISEIKYFKVYMSHTDSEIYYLQMVCDIQNKKYWSSTGGTERNAIYFADTTHSSWTYETKLEDSLNPNEVDSYTAETQIFQIDAENEHTMIAQYKTSVIAYANGEEYLYVGNIRQNGLIMSDTMIKSPPGKFGILPESNQLTLASDDGDEIIALHFFKNKLLQFRKNRVYVIGTDTDSDYLDEVIENVGIKHKSQVTTTSIGIFWVNERGCFGWNEEGVTNFTEGKIAQKKWKDSISSWLLFETLRPSIGYLKRENKLIIWPSTYNTSLTKEKYPVNYDDGLDKAERDNLERISTNEYGYIYDLDGKRWSMIFKGADGETPTSSLFLQQTGETSRMFGILTDIYNRPVTNFSYDINNNLIWGVANESGFKVYKWDDSPSTTSGIADNERDFRVVTKDYDFDLPSVKKKIYKVYVTFKSTFDDGDYSQRKELTQDLYQTPNVKVYYAINGTENWTEFSQTKSTNYDSSGLIHVDSEATTTLSSNIGFSDTALTQFASTSNMKVGYVLKVSTEQMLITDISSSTVTVTRGYNNTNQESHNTAHVIKISNGNWIEAELKPATSINNINSIKFKFATNTTDNKAVPKGFAINDISVLYRTKRVK